MLSLICLVFAFVLAVVAAFLTPAPAEPWRGRLLCFALACFFLGEILAKGALLHLGS